MTFLVVLLSTGVVAQVAIEVTSVEVGMGSIGVLCNCGNTERGAGITKLIHDSSPTQLAVSQGF